MKKGDLVRISFTGRVKETGELFDTTDETLAKKEGAYNPNATYDSVCLVVGEGRTLPGVDKKIQEMKEGEEVEVEIPPEEAFGSRSSNLIKLIPQTEFRKNGIDPTPGTMVNIGNLQGRIMSANSGRVRVDFNHPLAGKHLIYSIKVERELKTPEERSEGIVEYYLGNNATLKIENKEITVNSKIEVPDKVQQLITDDIKKHIEDHKVKFLLPKKEEKEIKPKEN